jgi:hypothetical protein
MASTQITGRQIADGSIERSDINISAAGKALIRKLIVTPSTGITISSYTGADSGTGDVTLAIDTNTIATRAWVQAQGYLTSDSYVSNVQLLGNSLEFTGVGNGFGGSVDLSSIIPTENDTLATVTSRGASTSTPVTFNGNVTLGNNADLIFQDLAGVFPTTGKGFDWTLNNDGARIYAIQPSSDSIDLVFQLRDNATTNDRFVFWVQEWRGAAYDKYPLIIRGGTEFDLVDSGLFVRGTQVITNGRNLQNVSGNISMFSNDSGYITAAALNGYATQTYVNTQVANLVDSAPGTLDTLNELAAALGDDPNFATTVTNSIATKVPQTRTLTINGVSYDLSADRSWTISTADGYINDVRLIGSILEFTGVGSAFNGNIDLNQLGYLTSFTETDPTVPAHVKSITTTEKSNWNTAYSWGNHATAGYQPASTAITTSNIGSQSVNYANSAGSSTTTLRGIVEDTRGGQRTPTDYDDYRVSWEFTNQIPGLNSGGSTWWSAMTIQGWHDGYAAWQIIGPASSAVEDFYLRSGNNATWNTSRRIWHNGDFTSSNVSNWNTAYSWGNHATAGYLTSYSETDTLASVTARGATTANAITVGSTTINPGYLTLSGASSSVSPELSMTDDSGFGVAGFKMRYGNSDGWTYYDSYWASGGGHRFRTSVASTAIEALTIKHTGEVGIGTVNPLYKLDVAGAVRLTGSLVFDDTTSNTIQHRAGTDVNTLVTVGHGGFDYNGYLRISGADVATRAWVQAQGYITSDTDAQTLSYNQGAKEITISNGNSITLDNLATEDFVTSQGYLTSLPSHNHDSLYVKLDGTSIVQNTLNINSNEMGGTARSWMTRGVVIGGGGSDGAYFGMKVISANNAQTVIAWGDDSGDDLHFINTLSGGPVDGVTYMTFFGSQNTIRMYKQLDVQSTIYSQEGNSSQWSIAYSWGNHASAGYLTSLPSHNHDDRYYTESESDARYSLSRGGLGTSSDVGNTTGWANNLAAGTYTRSYIGHSGQVIVSHDTGGSVGNIAIEATYYGAMYVHVNVDSSSWNSRQIWTSENFTSTTISNWNTAYGWGNHAGLYIPLSANVNATGWVSFSASTQGTPIIKAVQQDSSSGYYLFQGVTGSSEVFRVERSGNIYMTGNLVATQSWVQSQGYITSVSDVWVNTSGDTMTGSLRFNEGSGFGRVAYLDNYHGMILRGIPSDAAGNVTVGDYTSLIQHSGDFRFYRTNGSINELYFQVNASAAYWRGNTIWHSGNDGAGSGLDADLLDGFERSATGGGDRIAQYASNGYLYVNNWIHPANGTGLFYDSGPHFYESGGQMYSSHALRVNANILITDGTDNNRFTKGSNFLNLRDPWNNLHMQINSGGGMYFDAGHYYLRNANGGTNWLYLDGSNYNVYIEQHNYARVTFRYNTDRYAQSWYNSTTGAYWWVTTDAGQLGLHRNGDGDKFYFSNGGDFYSTTNGWLSTALAGKSNTGHTHDDRYYTESESDSRFVNVGGDSMTGTLYAPRVLLGSGTGDDYIGDGGIRIGRTDTDYTHGTSWSGTRSTMFIDCQDVATITIHDSGHRLVEYMTYSGGGTNIIYSGRDIGWGTTNWYFGADITVNGTITENSSIRYKENVKSLEYSSEAFAKLNPVRYNKKGSGVEEIGLIAEDVAALYPEVVKYDKDGNPDGVNYTRLSAILIKAVQELTDKVNQLEKNA